MKKFAEKHDLVKIAGIMVLISVLLTWVIPQGYFSGAELTSNDITRVGIFDFFTYGLLGMYYAYIGKAKKLPILDKISIIKYYKLDY